MTTSLESTCLIEAALRDALNGRTPSDEDIALLSLALATQIRRATGRIIAASAIGGFPAAAAEVTLSRTEIQALSTCEGD